MSVYEISCSSVKQMLKYGDFSIFQDCERCDLGFSNFENFNARNAQEGHTASAYQFSSKSVQPRPRCSDFSRWQLPPSWIFTILTVGTIKKAKLHHHANLHGN